MKRLPFKLGLLILWLFMAGYPPQGFPQASSGGGTTSNNTITGGFTSSTNIGVAQTYNYNPNGTGQSSVNASVSVPMRAGTVQNLRVNPAANTLNAGSVTVFIFKNGVATNVGVSIPASSTAIVNDLTHTATFLAGDTLSVVIVISGSTAGSINPGWSFEFV